MNVPVVAKSGGAQVLAVTVLGKGGGGVGTKVVIGGEIKIVIPTAPEVLYQTV